ncbi:hypothetical protein LCGC14_2461680 [marine sediment metagenome]|uniref:Uncharacterized protein n=1 Tax=marine sediment metagenome TaxID=412755 RepID=A0A0F9E6Z8_9ZZZZ
MSVKELKCAIFGHIWEETGHRTCMKHNEEYGHYRICERCKLQENIGKNICEVCTDEYFLKVMR